MIVFDLLCALGHKFEGWFASEETYQDQLNRSLLSCPVCGSQDVSKALSAPRLHKKSNQKESLSSELAKKTHSTDGLNKTGESAEKNMQMAIAEQVIGHILKNTEDVGDQFAEEARKIHYGEVQERSIRGLTTMEEAQELHEEGINLVELPLNLIDRKKLQ